MLGSDMSTVNYEQIKHYLISLFNYFFFEYTVLNNPKLKTFTKCNI